MTRRPFTVVYSVDDDDGDSPTGTYYFPTLAAARRAYPREEVTRCEVAALPRRAMVAALLNHDGWCAGSTPAAAGRASPPCKTCGHPLTDHHDHDDAKETWCRAYQCECEAFR